MKNYHIMSILVFFSISLFCCQVNVVHPFFSSLPCFKTSPNRNCIKFRRPGLKMTWTCLTISCDFCQSEHVRLLLLCQNVSTIKLTLLTNRPLCLPLWDMQEASIHWGGRGVGGRYLPLCLTSVPLFAAQIVCVCVYGRTLVTNLMDHRGNNPSLQHSADQ